MRGTIKVLLGAAVLAALSFPGPESIFGRAGHSLSLVGAASACDRACSDPNSRYVVTKTGNRYVAGKEARGARLAVKLRVARAHKRARPAIAVELNVDDRTLTGFAVALDKNPVGVYSQLTGCLPASVKAKIGEIERRWGKVRVVSTFRRGAVVAGSGSPSLHASCRAIDFHPPKGKHREVAAWLKATHAGGVGTYSCAMHHIHIDNGRRARWHHCVGARGTPRRRG